MPSLTSYMPAVGDISVSSGTPATLPASGYMPADGDISMSSTINATGIGIASFIYDNEAGKSGAGLATVYVETLDGPNYLRPVIGLTGDKTFKIDDYLGVSHLVGTENNPRGVDGQGIPVDIPLVATGSGDLLFSVSKTGPNWALWTPPGASNSPLVIVVGSSPAWGSPELPTRLRSTTQPMYDLYKAGYNVAFVSHTGPDYPAPEDDFASAYGQIQQQAGVDAAKTAVFGAFNGAEVAARAALDVTLLAAATQPVATVLYAGTYNWGALLDSLPAYHFPDGATLGDVADKDSPSPIWYTTTDPSTARDAHVYLADAEGVTQNPSSILGPPWVTNTVAREDDPWQGAALFDRLGTLASTAATHGGIFDPNKVKTWIRNEIGL